MSKESPRKTWTLKNVMSGKIIGKTDVKSYDSQKSLSAMKSAATPPPLPASRTSSKTIPPYPAPKPPFCQKCGPEEGCLHRYEDIMIKQNDSEVAQYEQLTVPEDTTNKQISARLLKIEDNQMRLRSEFNDFRESVEQSIKLLHSSVRRVIEMNDALDESMRESFAFIQSNMEKSHQQLLENSDHLGKQMLDVRREIITASKNPTSVNTPADSCFDGQQRKAYIHILEWELCNIDRMVTQQQKASSQSHLIGQLDYKIIGGAVCTRDGYLRVRIHGMFTHVPTESKDKKNGNFECSAFLVDKSGKKVDMIIGQITGDFNTDKEWVVGNVSVAEIKVNGYVTDAGNANLKFVIQVSA